MLEALPLRVVQPQKFPVDNIELKLLQLGNFCAFFTSGIDKRYLAQVSRLGGFESVLKLFPGAIGFYFSVCFIFAELKSGRG